ncbi:MAG: hypothetical protein R3290_05055 [Acidimicrobiia bacterium]|nr:hypothetical protein [Acidimicrobiia bacterium]
MSPLVVPDVGVVDRRMPAPADVRGLLAGSVEGEHPVVLTGADGRAWWSAAVSSPDLVFALWTDPGQQLVVYGGDPDTMRSRLETATVAIAAGRLQLELNPAWSRARAVEGDVASFFGVDVVVSTDDPIEAATRIAGDPAGAGEMLGLVGTTATLLAQPGSQLADRLAAAGARPPTSLTLVDGEGELGAIMARSAWTRALGAFQVRSVSSLDGLGAVLDGSVGDMGVVVGDTSARGRAGDLLGGDEAFDVVAAAHSGGRTSFVTDLVTAFGALGVTVVTGSAVPVRPTVVLRGEAAEQARLHLDLEEPTSPMVTMGALAGEHLERYVAHQWVGSMRRAARAATDTWPVGGPTAASEARATGLVGSASPSQAPNAIDGEAMVRVARARGWHDIDPALPPVLDRALVAARRQLVGDDTPVPGDVVERVTEWGGRPGFWADLLSGVEWSGDRIVLPYPAPAIEILRAVVVSGGNAAELRSWLGPVKAAVYRGLAGGADG